VHGIDGTIEDSNVYRGNVQMKCFAVAGGEISSKLMVMPVDSGNNTTYCLQQLRKTVLIFYGVSS
jgi:hypothetical protein